MNLNLQWFKLFFNNNPLIEYLVTNFTMTQLDRSAIVWSIGIVAIAIAISFYNPNLQQASDQIVVNSHVLKNEIFFTLQGDDSVGNIRGEIFDAGPKMTYISASSDGELILATSSASDTVFAFDKQGNNLASIKVGKTPKGVKIHPFEDIAFVANENSGSISVIDTRTFQVTKEIPVGKIPHNLRFSPDGNTAYVTLQGGDAVIVIDVNLLLVTDSISVEKLPHNLDITPDGKYLFTANIGTSDVAVIDLNTNEIIKRISVSTGHHGIDVSPDGKRMYVSGIGSNLVNVIDVKSLKLIKTIPVGDGPHGLRTSLDNSLLYVGVTGTNEIVIIDTQSLTIQEHIPVGHVPFWIASKGNP